MPDDAAISADSRQAEGVGQLIELITSVRAARAESGIEAGQLLPALIWLPDGPARDAYEALESAVGRLARIRPTLVDSRDALDTGSEPGLAVISAHGEARLTRSNADREREGARLEKELRAVQQQLEAAEARLSDHSFMTRAPDNVVEHARRRAAELREQAAALHARLNEG